METLSTKESLAKINNEHFPKSGKKMTDLHFSIMEIVNGFDDMDGALIVLLSQVAILVDAFIKAADGAVGTAETCNIDLSNTLLDAISDMYKIRALCEDNVNYLSGLLSFKEKDSVELGVTPENNEEIKKHLDNGNIKAALEIAKKIFDAKSQ